MHKDLSRRGFLRASSAAALAALAGSEPRLLASTAKIAPRADCMILLWMAGGMAQTETFDPKRTRRTSRAWSRSASSAPSRRSTRWSITSRSPQGLERIAKIMDRGTLIRSHRVGDLGFILHSRHQYHWHTGYAPPQSVAAPAHGRDDFAHLGAAQSGDSGVHRHRPESRDRRGDRFGKGFSYRRLFGQRTRAVSDLRPQRCGVACTPFRAHWPGTVRQPLRAVQEVGSSQPGGPIWQRLSARKPAAVAGECAQAAQFASDRSKQTMHRAHDHPA